MSAVQIVSKEYINLIRKFALMPIRTKAQLRRAAAVIDELSDRLGRLSKPERAYFDVLCELVKHYESGICQPLERLTPPEALKYLMEVNGLTLNDLLPVVRHKSHLSAFLNGKRGLSKVNALRLVERFKVSPKLFLQAN